LSGVRALAVDILDRIAAIDFHEASDRIVEDADIKRLSKAIGLTRIAWTTQLDRLSSPSVYCVRPAARDPCAIYSSGKAFDARHAVLSGLFECYERWAAEDAAFCLEASSDELAEHAQGLNLTLFEPPGSESTRPVRWAFGRDLASAAFAAIPACFVEFPPEAGSRQRFTTTGLAAHASLPQAVSNALLECVERHQAAALLSDKLVRVGDDHFSDEARCLAGKFECENVELQTFVIDANARVRTVYCYAYDHWLGVPRIHCSGYGASGHLRVAVDKAMLEVVQSRAAMISGLRDDVSARVIGKASHQYHENLEHLAWLEKLRSVDRVFDAGPRPEPMDTIENIVAGLTSDHCTALVFPLRSALGFPAVRAIIPELDDCC
jgi:ribosomal protein S12 methylthiotransferase accessory factor